MDNFNFTYLLPVSVFEKTTFQDAFP